LALIWRPQAQPNLLEGDNRNSIMDSANLAGLSCANRFRETRMAAVGAASVWAAATGDKGAFGPSWQVPLKDIRYLALI
jgi:hypothetical protein